jgi:uncharacterized membrane protein (DUF485 family)
MLERMKSRSKLVRPLLVPLILYVGVLAFSFNWLADNLESNWRYLVALLPMLPGIFIAFGVVRAIQKLDEMERKVMLESAAVSFMLTMILVMSLGLLNIAEFPPVNGIYIGLFMAIIWLIAKLWIHRSYE